MSSPRTAKDAKAAGPDAPEKAEAAAVADPGLQAKREAEKKKDKEKEKKSDPEPADDDELHNIGIELKDEDGNPVVGEDYRVELPDGDTVSGSLDDQGRAWIEGIPPGQCQICFPRIHGNEVSPK